MNAGSSIRGQAEQILQAYGRIAAMPGLTFGEQGCARVIFDESIVLDIEIDEAAGRLLVHGVVGAVPPQNREALFRSLLEANLSEPRPATLAIDAVQDEILATRPIDLSQVSSGLALGNLLNEFADVVEHWKSKLGSGPLKPPGKRPFMSEATQAAFIRRA